jgi:glutamate/aspartate transport system substrate-binding protein
MLAIKYAVAALAIGMAGLNASVCAETLDGTLRKVAEKGEITIGHRDSAIPLSFLDGQQAPVGYSVDLCRKIVDNVKTRLNRPDLKINFLPVTSQTRIPLMANGTIDLECGSTTNTRERQSQVAFTVTPSSPRVDCL